MERYRFSGLVNKRQMPQAEILLSEAGFYNIAISKKPFQDYKNYRAFDAEINVADEEDLSNALRMIEERLILPYKQDSNPPFISFGAQRDSE